MGEETANLQLNGFEFFKVLLPGTYKKLRLPPKFTGEFKEGQLRNVKLRVGRGGRLWDVKIGGRGAELYFADGWEAFVRAHGLRDGLFLVFRYDGGAAVLTVTVFDESACRKDYPSVEGGTSGGTVEAAGHVTPQFAVTLGPGNFGKKQDQYLNVPVPFQEQHGYLEKSEVVLRMGGRSWIVKLKHSRRAHGMRTAFRYGWHRFWQDSGLEVGDTCFFHVLTDGDGEDGQVLKVEVRKKDGSYIV